jgi:DNA-binding response OmpR family regulator
MLMTVNQASSTSSTQINACPHCGAHREITTVVNTGAWHLQPSFATFQGRALHLTGAEAAMLYTLGKAAGNVVDSVTLGRQFSISADCSNSVRVIISRLRKKLGANCPIQTVRGGGYRWNDTTIRSN